jgi:hypothetical protein
MFPFTLTIVGVIVATALALWVAKKDQSARPVGLVALVPIVFVTGWTWFRDLPEWTAWTTLLVVLVLFIVGMLRDESRDDAWHYGAMAFALFGKLLCWFLPWLLSIIMNDYAIKGPVLLFLLIAAALIALGFYIAERRRRRDYEPEPASI